MHRSRIKSFLDQLQARPDSATGGKIVHKSKHGFIAMPKVKSRSRSRSGSRRVGKPRSRAHRVPTPFPAQTRIKISNYFPLTGSQLQEEGRWMANEDLNIWLYVSQFGGSLQKRSEYWQQGYNARLWRETKTVASLRSRFRFYLTFLTASNSKQIKKFLNSSDSDASYLNFESAGGDTRKMTSITDTKPAAASRRHGVRPATGPTYIPDERFEDLFSRRQPRFTKFSPSQWFSISRSYWDQWRNQESDLRNWITFDDGMQRGGEDQ